MTALCNSLQKEPKEAFLCNIRKGKAHMNMLSGKYFCATVQALMPSSAWLFIYLQRIIY